jgi:hypothetical protein
MNYLNNKNVFYIFFIQNILNIFKITPFNNKKFKIKIILDIK